MLTSEALPLKLVATPGQLEVLTSLLLGFVNKLTTLSGDMPGCITNAKESARQIGILLAEKLHNNSAFVITPRKIDEDQSRDIKNNLFPETLLSTAGKLLDPSIEDSLLAAMHDIKDWSAPRDFFESFVKVTGINGRYYYPTKEEPSFKSTQFNPSSVKCNSTADSDAAQKFLVDILIAFQKNGNTYTWSMKENVSLVTVLNNWIKLQQHASKP
jgi:hypothetical protein